MEDAVLQTITEYFIPKVKAHGATPLGVDWNTKEAQELRYEQLSKILPSLTADFSILDFGSGYGGYLDYVRMGGFSGSYTGVDAVEEMTKLGSTVHKDDKLAEFICSTRVEQKADYIVASGVFNQRGQIDDRSWTNYTIKTLDNLNEHARFGMAVNFLTAYSDKEKMRSDLYYPHPTVLFEHCVKNYSRNVALLHDYDAYEFTLLIRKFP